MRRSLSGLEGIPSLSTAHANQQPIQNALIWVKSAQKAGNRYQRRGHLPALAVNTVVS